MAEGFEIGQAFVSVKAELDKKSVAGIGDQIGDSVDAGSGGLKSKMGSTGAGMGKALGVGLIGAATAGIAAGGAAVMGGLEGVMDAEKIAAQTDAVIKSMGGASNVTASEVKGLGDEIERVTGVQSEAVQEAQNLMLTFGNVKNEVGAGNDIFNQATHLMTDMSVALGTDVSSGAIQLGKALNDPIAGVGALGEVGVSFTEQQKEQIKTLTESGDVMAAQKIILGELENQFGGSAAAMGDTTAGKVEKMKNSFEDLQKNLASSFMPVIDKLINAGNGQLIPTLSKLADTFAQVLLPVLDALIPVIDPIVDMLGVVMQAALEALMPVVQALAPVIAQLAPIFGQVMAAIAPLLTPLGMLVAAFAPLLVPIANLIAMLVEGLVPILMPIIELAVGLANTLVSILTPAINALQPVINAIIPIIGLLFKPLEFLIGLVDLVFQAFKGLGDGIGQIWDSIVGSIKSSINWIIELVNGMIERINGIEMKVPDWVPGMGGKTFGMPDIPKIPMLAEGGHITGSGLSLVGEEGPELLNLPSGASVVPLDKTGDSITIQNLTVNADNAEEFMDSMSALQRRLKTA